MFHRFKFSKSPLGDLGVLSHPHRLHRILIRHSPILKRYRTYRQYRHSHKSQYIHPPIHRRAIRKVFQPTTDRIPPNRYGYHETNQQNSEISLVEHQQNIGGGSTVHFANADFSSPAFAVEHHQAKHAGNGYKDGYQAEKSY